MTDLRHRILFAGNEQYVLDEYARILREPAASSAAALEASDLTDGHVIKEANYDTALCKQGSEAVDSIRLAVEENLPYSVAFLDVQMPPGIDGIETAAQICTIDPWINIVLITEGIDTYRDEFVRKVPPSDKMLICQKPVQAVELKQLTRTLAAKWSTERDLRESNMAWEARVIERTGELQESVEELRIAKESSELANQAKTEFLAKVSHELRTPLTAILGYSEILIEDAQIDGAQERLTDLQRIQRSGYQLLVLINDILDIAKIEAGKLELQISNVDFTDLIDELESTSAPLMKINGNIFTIEVANDLGSFECDSHRLQQILLNLLSNAAKFTEQGTVELSAKRTGDGWVRFAVRDTGIGMNAEEVERIFGPFNQAEGSIGKNYGGTGLGLAISQHLAKMMGGGITVDTVVGAGSCFTVTLPVT